MKEFRELTLHFLNMDTYVDFQKTGGKGVFGRQKLQNHMFKLIRVYLKAVKKQKQKNSPFKMYLFLYTDSVTAVKW